MSTTLSNGYKKPDTGDRGSSFFPDLEDNIQRVNDHNHDGNNSEKLDPTSIDNITQSLSSASWTLVSPGVYRQLVTLPNSMLFDEKIMQFQIASGADDGAIFYPTFIKETSTTYYLYINDNSVDVLVKYT